MAVLFLRETFIHMKLFKTVHICSNERRLCVLGFLATYCRRNNSTQCQLRRIKPDRQDAIALDYCVMHVWFNKLKCSDFFYISMWTTYQLRPNNILQRPHNHNTTQFWFILVPSSGHIYSLYCSIHSWFYKLKSADRFYYIHVDDISTPTSGMLSLARMTLRYSFTADSINASREHI